MQHHPNTLKSRLYLVFALFIASTDFGFANETTNSKTVQTVSKYVQVDPSELKHGQLWPLNHVLTFEAGDYNNIGDAIRGVLFQIGYQIDPEIYSESFGEVLNYPVPPIHQTFESNSVKAIIEALMGPAFLLIVDPVSRVVSFELDLESIKVQQ